MTANEFLEKAERFEGTAFVGFELEGKLLAIGRRTERGAVCLYERDHDAEPEGHWHTLAVFTSPLDAAKAGAFIASMGEVIEALR